MKKIYTFAALLLAFNSAIAQPAFTSGDFLATGMSDSMVLAATGATITEGLALEGSTGNAYTWDYSSLVFAPTTLVYSCSVPKPSDYYSFPPEANLKEESIVLTMDNLYQKLTDTVYLSRSGSSNVSGTVMLPKVRYMTFPLNYGDSLGSRQLEYSNVAMTIPGFTRTHSYKYDGFGTVKLPWGTYPNVFRIKTTTRDSSHIIANYIVTYSAYHYFRQGGGMPLVRFISTSFGDSINHYYNLVANKTAKVPSAVHEISTRHEMHIYPNPAIDQLFIDSDHADELTFSITDMAGRKLTAGKVPVSNEPVSISDLAKGLYLISVFDNDEHLICNSKFVKQ